MARLIKPPSLSIGDTVSIIAPAASVEADYIKKSVNILESWGLKVKQGNNLFSKYYQFAGSDEQRLADLQNAIDDEETKAIFCARGGYGIVRIVDNVIWSKFIENPKWIIGFSDVTILHSAVHNLGIQSLHACMPINLNELPITSEAVELLGQVLFEGKLKYTLKPSQYNQTGTEKALITGGNLSILHSLFATKFDVSLAGKILFIEEVGEQYYKLDRMLQSFRLSGKLDSLCGIIIGGLSEMEDNKRPFGKIPEEIIAEITTDYDFPVVFNFPAGHIKDNLPIILGADTAVEVKSMEVNIRMD